jgi:carboxymethylenebutenolidase
VAGTFNWMQRYAGGEVVEHAREGRLSRREMMRQLVAIAGSAAGGAALLAACGGDDDVGSTDSSAAPTTPSSATTPSTAPTSAAAPTTGGAGEVGSTLVVPPTSPDAEAILSVAADDPAVRVEDVTFPGPASTMLGYLARPAADGSRAGVIVIHEIFGLTDHIRDVARRAAKAGYLALAPDLASRAGGTEQAGNVSGALTQSPVEDRVADLDAAFAYLGEQLDFDGKLGVVGFCFGGGMTLSYAAAQPQVAAAVSYYGPTPQPPSVMSATKAAILGNYGADDGRVNAGIPDLEAALAGKTFEKRIYDGVGHAFNNDTRDAYDEAAAVAAWTATLEWFGRYLA